MNRISTKVYLYDSSQEANGYKGTDYSKYVLIGDSDTDNLDDTLDTSELTLAGLSFREEFAPTTKFIVEKWQNTQTEGSTDELISTFHWVVSNDTVTQPILSRDDYFNHELSLIEPTVIAQQRLVDNIAVTYELKDVNLEATPTYSLTDNIKVSKRNFFQNDSHLQDYSYKTTKKYFAHKMEWIMPDWYTLNYGGVTKTPSWEDWYNFNLNQIIPYGQTQKTVYIPVPMLKCFYSHIPNGESNYWAPNGFCSIEVLVVKKPVGGGSSSIVFDFLVNPSESYSEESFWNKDFFNTGENTQFLANGDIISRVQLSDGGAGSTYPGLKYFISKARNLDSSIDLSKRLITLTIEVGYQYTISIKKHAFKSTNGNYPYQGVDAYPYGESYSIATPKFFGGYDVSNSYNSPSNSNVPSCVFTFNAVSEVAPLSIYLKKAPPANAYDLFVKAQLTTQNFKKKWGVPVKDTTTPFYVNDDDVQQLQNTTIIENFYNQKNLHEIFMDIGKYIHARPKAKFGSDDRFEIEWKKYGQTEQNPDGKDENSKPISIFNSKFVEEYISSVSSYVTNMVQLGGTITEILAPKSSSEDYLVYNDVAELKTSKNIIQIDNLEVIRKTDREIRNLTGNGTQGESENGYVFEQNVYQLLSLDAYDNINKGLAIYYELGTNVIKGLNFQLPSRTVGLQTTVYDYTIKRIIGTVYGLQESDWANIKVNDYLFRITYKTKDTLRTDQTRPDLRKYLINCKYDNIPIHYQFNNQQDLVVDSTKFGHNMYGKLIRTGNTTYERVEYIVNLSQVKHSGELYNIYGNLYYVSKVINTYYPNYIISQVEFSKDFNRLSEIIGIPSEPRFYEISEQSLINREVPINDYIMLRTGGQPGTQEEVIKSIRNSNIYDWAYLESLIFGNHYRRPGDNPPDPKYPKYAITYFKNDIDSYYPSNNEGQAEYLVTTCSPLSVYSIDNTLTLEWDMEDNFSAGDQVIETTNPSGTAVDKSYNTLNPFRYPDIYGRCDMYDFAIVPDIPVLNPQSSDFDSQKVMELPASPAYINLGFYDPENWISQKPIDMVFSSGDIMPKNGIDFRFVSLLNPVLITNLKNYLNNISTNNPTKFGDIFRMYPYDYDFGTQSIVFIGSQYYMFNYEGTTYRNYIGDVTESNLPSSPNIGDTYYVTNRYTYYMWDNLSSEGSPQYGWVNLFKPLTGGFKDHSQGNILLKDNREAISFNQNIQLLNDSDRFVISSYLWQPEKQDVYIGLLNKEVNKITNNTITDADFYVERIPLWTNLPTITTVSGFSKQYTISILVGGSFDLYKAQQGISESDFQEILTNTKAIVIYSDRWINDNANAGAKYFIMAKNVDGLTNQQKTADWSISNIMDRDFTKQ